MQLIMRHPRESYYDWRSRVIASYRRETGGALPTVLSRRKSSLLAVERRVEKLASERKEIEASLERTRGRAALAEAFAELELLFGAGVARIAPEAVNMAGLFRRSREFEVGPDNLPLREPMRAWLRENLGRGDIVRYAGQILEGRDIERKLNSLYANLNKYMAEDRDYGEAVELVIQSVDELVYPQEHPEGPGGVRCPGADGGLLCFLHQVKKRWPHMTDLCTHLNREWETTTEGVTAERIREFVRLVGSREWYNKSIGVELRDRAGAVWWSHNTLTKEGKRQAKVLALVAGCSHVEGEPRADIMGVEDLPHEVFHASMREGRWASIVHDNAFIHERILYRNEDFVKEVQDQGKDGGMKYDFLKAFDENPCCASVHGVTTAVFRKKCQARGYGVGPMRDYLAECQIEHYPAEFEEIRPTDVVYDANKCFASYKMCWYTDYYRRFGLPMSPSLGGWLPLDLSPEEQEALLWQTGFALVDQVKVSHWSLEKFPYLLDGRPYPIVWLRFLKDRGVATFRLRHVLLGGKFHDHDLAGGDVIRKVVGKWVQRKEITRYFVVDLKEAERLAFTRYGQLEQMEAVNGGYMLKFGAESPIQYPHLRAYVLAYSHIVLFHKLLKLAAPPVAVKTDSITLRERDGEIFVQGWDVDPSIPGRWKIEADARNGIFKKDKDTGASLPLKGVGYGEGRLAAAREALAARQAQIPQEFGGDLEPLLRGDPRRGVEPLVWETEWRYPLEKLNVASEGEMPAEFDITPLEVHLLGGGGFGKSTWAAAELPKIMPRMGLSAYQHETVEDLRGKFGGEFPAVTLHSWLFPPTDKIRAEAAKASRAEGILVDESSMITDAMLAKFSSRAPNSCLFLAGDEAQTSPVDTTKPRIADYCGFHERLAHKLYFTKDWRSKDSATAAAKDRVRMHRMADARSDDAQLQELLAAGVATAASLDEVDPEGLVVICGRTATRDAANESVRKRIFGRKEPKPGDAVPIRCNKTYAGGNAGARLRVAWREAKRLLATKKWGWGFASTVHAVQGKTIERPQRLAFVVDWTCPGLVYTAASRVESLSQLVVVGYAPAEDLGDFDPTGDPDYNT